MNVLVSALVLLGPPGEERPRSTVLRDLTTQVVKLSQTRGTAARAEALGGVATRLSDEAVTLSTQPGRVEESIYLSVLALRIASRGIATKMTGAEDDNPEDDARWSSASASAENAVKGAKDVRAALAEDQRARIQEEINAAEPAVKKASDWLAARLERHGSRVAPPDESEKKPEEKKKDGTGGDERPN